MASIASCRRVADKLGGVYIKGLQGPGLRAFRAFFQFRLEGFRVYRGLGAWSLRGFIWVVKGPGMLGLFLGGEDRFEAPGCSMEEYELHGKGSGKGKHRHHDCGS